MKRLLSLVVVVAGAAWAQAPANDTCANAELLTPPSASGSSVQSALVNPSGATAAVETPFTCGGTTQSKSVWYTFTAPVTGTYVISSCGLAAYDTVLEVYEGSCAAPTSLVNGCNNDGCLNGYGLTSTVVVDLTAGTTYYAQLAGRTSTSVSTTSTTGLSIAVGTPNPQDQCSVTTPLLTLEVPQRVSSELEQTTGQFITTNQAQLDAGACFVSAANSSASPTAAPGRDVAWGFRADEAGSYSFRVSQPSKSTNVVLYATNTCLPAGAPSIYGPGECLGAANRATSASTSYGEAVTCVPMTANQTVTLWVDEAAVSDAGFSARLEAIRCVNEREPNDTPATATALSCVMTGSIGAANDADFYAVGGWPAGSRLFAMAEGQFTSSTDFDLRATTATRLLEYDDADLDTPFGSLAPTVTGVVLPAEPAYLAVSYFSSTTLSDPYFLYSKVQLGAPAAEVEPNDSVATATPGAGYWTGSIADAGSDTDYFQVTAQPGQVLFVAIDGSPDKTVAGPSRNFGLGLVDPSGTEVVTVNDSNTSATLTPTDAGIGAKTPTFPGDALVWRAQTAGTYTVRVFKSSGAGETPYILSASVGCGDVAPALASVSPSSGSPAGGDIVTLTGANFSDRSVVRFGSAIATVVSVDATTLVVKTPPSPPGEAAVTVTNGVGLTATLSPGFTFEDPPGIPPTLTSLTPTRGPSDGGTSVTLTGAVFRPDAGVFFEVGGVAVGATSVTVNTSTRITAVTPPQAEGWANVTVVNTDGLTSTLDAGFLFDGPPFISSITPAVGLTSGGQTVTLTGNNFRPGTTVKFGATNGTAVTPAADGLSLTVVTPAAATAGVVDVLVTETNGQTALLTGGFTYQYATPTVVAVTPASGFTSGGTSIAITGTNFIGTPVVKVGGTLATNVSRTSATTITATTPAGAAGPADVSVTIPDGQVATLTGGFTYVPPPSLASVSPDHGPAQGGFTLTLTGANFVAPARVTVGGVPAVAVRVVSPTTITAQVQRSPAGVADVVETNADGQSATLSQAFTFDGAPKLLSVSPSRGSSLGGTTVTLAGEGFVAGTTVQFGAQEATDVTVVSGTSLTAVAPAGTGTVNVAITRPDGQTALISDGFIYVAPPTVSSLDPATGPSAGGTTVHLTGTGLRTNTRVRFGGTEAAAVTWVSDTQLDVVTPAHAGGAVAVEVDTDGITSALADAFTYTRPPLTLDALAPSSGPSAGGTVVTLSGSGFAAGATVTFDDVAATSVVVVSGSLVRATAPAHEVGRGSVVVTNDDGQSATLPNAFAWTENAVTDPGTITDGGSGVVGEEPPTPMGGEGGISCGCSSFDGSAFTLASLGLLLLRSRRRRG